jgi:hypothetical protein
MDVDHRRLHVRVAHVGLHVGEREHADREGPGRIAQVVEAQLLDAGALARRVTGVEAPNPVLLMGRGGFEPPRDGL